MIYPKWRTFPNKTRTISRMVEQPADHGVVEEPRFRGTVRAGSCGVARREAVLGRAGAMGVRWRLPGSPARPDDPQNDEKGAGEPLEIDRRSRQVGLDLHVVETAPDRAP